LNANPNFGPELQSRADGLILPQLEICSRLVIA
jgi:hypothetical protein